MSLAFVEIVYLHKVNELPRRKQRGILLKQTELLRFM